MVAREVYEERVRIRVAFSVSREVESVEAQSPLNGSHEAAQARFGCRRIDGSIHGRYPPLAQRPEPPRPAGRAQRAWNVEQGGASHDRVDEQKVTLVELEQQREPAGGVPRASRRLAADVVGDLVDALDVLVSAGMELREPRCRWDRWMFEAKEGAYVVFGVIVQRRGGIHLLPAYEAGDGGDVFRLHVSAQPPAPRRWLTPPTPRSSPTALSPARHRPPADSASSHGTCRNRGRRAPRPRPRSRSRATSGRLLPP